MAHETLEERNLKVLEGYVDYARTRDSSRCVQDYKAMSAATQLGDLRSKPAIPLLVQCILVTCSFDAGVAFRDALVSIGRPALVTIETALSNSGFGGFRIYPAGPHRNNIEGAKNGILKALRPKVKESALDTHS
jgi:hypothetical protein